MEAFLRLLIPKILSDTSFEVHAHQGKADLLKQLPTRLAGYASWLPDMWRIVVIVDRDDDDCAGLKERLEAMAAEVGLATRSTDRTAYTVANRLAIEELEAWYFGDWDAVRAAYPRVSATVPAKARFRDPDAIRGGTWECFEQVLQRAGYFRGGLRKIAAARAVAEHLVPDRNTSQSFRALLDVLAEMNPLAQGEAP